MEEKTYYLYKHTNKINGKCYIGITVFNDNPYKRWGKNGSGYNTQFFGRAINKYGWDNFEHEIIFKDLTESEAKEKEQLYIKMFDSSNPKKGYNLTKGGDGSLGLYPSEETKRKQSISAMNRKDFKCEVICLETLDVFNNCSDCARKLGVDSSCVSRTCNTQNQGQKTIKNMHFMYLSEYDKDNNPYYVKNKTFEELLEINKNIPINSKKHICLETNQIFNSGSNVKKWLGCKVRLSTLQKPCNITSKNDNHIYHIMLLDEYNKCTKDEIEYIKSYKVPKEVHMSNCRKCIDLLTLKVYKSCKDYSDVYNIYPSAGRKRCNKGKLAMWYDDYIKIKEDIGDNL